MKTDNYLNLCLEQAAKSPLRYRHGAIIVRGGKVIGRGHNDYRPGFNGGALKTGRLPLRSLDSPSITELKKKHKHKRDTTNDGGQETTKTFTPFESMTGGGGKLANIPLSMHSEMMAIHEALAACNTELSSAVSSQEPCFKLLGDSKRKARLRREAINTYVEAVCKFGAEQGHGKPYVQEWRFEDPTSGSPRTEPRVSTRGGQDRADSHSEQYGETPNEEREEETTIQFLQQVGQWTTQIQVPTVCT